MCVCVCVLNGNNVMSACEVLSSVSSSNLFVNVICVLNEFLSFMLLTDLFVNAVCVLNGNNVILLTMKTVHLIHVEKPML